MQTFVEASAASMSGPSSWCRPARAGQLRTDAETDAGTGCRSALFRIGVPFEKAWLPACSQALPDCA
jgi:hypothetical protein